jgi:tetratricopeptide (TPR) repeat protein
MNGRKSELSSLLSNIPVFLLGVLFLLFPLIYSTVTTDAFLLPKEYLLAIVVTLSVLFIGIRMIFDGKLRLRTTPFDLPIALFIAALFISSFISINRFDSIIAFVPMLYTALLYFLIVNIVKSERSLTFLLACIMLGASLTSAISVLSFFHIYPLPFSYTKSPYFTTMGTLFDQAIYFAMVLPIGGYFAYIFASTMLNRRNASTPFSTDTANNGKTLIFTIGTVITLLGFLVTLFHLFTTQKPIILPFSTGFQIAFATISQDAGRMLQSFLFGSGTGTFITDFTRFKQSSYNAFPTLWSVTFLRSSSFVLELMATAGILGLASFFFIVLRFIRERSFFLPLLVGFVAAFLFPFSPLVTTILFALLGIFAVVRAQNNAPAYNDVELHLVTERVHHQAEGSNLFGKRYSKLLPIILFLVIAGVVGYTGYYTTLFGMSDMTFQQSLFAAAKNNGSQTYTLQQQAIATFPYRDTYHRVFSQTNLALANALAAQTPQGSSPSAQTQQNVLTLIQQAITTGRSATAIAPYSAVNWNNLSSVYRSLIGFGQNAEQFSVLTNQQAIALDPSNPQQYVNLGGIYYQLGMWDDASRQFQIAINLKQDYANAYYNLGHTLESKGDYNNAVLVYNVVKSLVQSEKDAVKKMDEEIAAVKQKSTAQQVAGAQTEVSPTPAAQPTAAAANPLQVNNKATTQLPERNPKAKIEGPTISPIPSPSTSKQPAPTQAAQ